MLMQTARKRLTSSLPCIVFIICILQPLLDVLSFWTAKLGIPNAFTLAIRLLLMLFIVLIAFVLTKRRKVYYIAILSLVLLTIGHIFACMQQGYGDIVGDLTNLVRIYHFPILTICFITFLKTDRQVYKTIIKGFITAFLIVIAVKLLSVITSTNPYTYPNKQLGILGWFYFANTQSAIISVLVTVFVYKAVIKFKDNLPLMLISVFVAMGTLYLFATRLTYAALLIIGIGMIITILITDRTQKRAIIALALVTLVFAALFPLSPMYSNQKQFAANLQKEQEKIDELIIEYEESAISRGLSGKEFKTARLEGVYYEHLEGLVERFGLEKTVEHYDYTKDAVELYNFRQMKLSYNEMLMEEYGITARLFGLELSDLTSAGIIHDVENDFHGIYYLLGSFGLILLIVFISYFIILIIKALVRDFKNVFNIESAAWGIALITLLMHVYATAGVLRRPNGSFYLSVVLAVIYYLTKIRSYEEDPLTLPDNERTSK